MAHPALPRRHVERNYVGSAYLLRAGNGLQPQLTQLIDANRIPVDHEIPDAFGHVGERSRGAESVLSHLAEPRPASVREEDIQVVSLDDDTDDNRPSYLEQFIHAEVYRARPDVMAVVHSHSPGVLSFGLTDVPLRPVLNMAGFLAPAVPAVATRDSQGTDRDLLIRSTAAGRELTQTLGDARVVLMRGHGVTAVARSLPEAVYRALYTETNARADLLVASLEAVTPLTTDEALVSAAVSAGQLPRAWNYWKARA